MRSPVAGTTRFDFLINLYPKMKIKYNGIPGSGKDFCCGDTNVRRDEIRRIPLFSVSWCIKGDLPSAQSYRNLAGMLARKVMGHILKIVTRMQNINADHVPKAPKGER